MEWVTIDGTAFPLGSKRRGGTDDDPAVEVRSSGWIKARLTVRRRTVAGKMVAREQIHVNSAVLGGAGEVEAHKDSNVVPLLAEVGSRSAARDAKRAAHPERFALIAGVTTLARLIVPLLGLGALFAWLTEPMSRWLAVHVQPWFEPIAQWLVTVFTPIGRFLGWLFDLLFGWVSYLVDWMPDWLSTGLRIALLVLIAYSASRASMQRRKKKLEESQNSSSVGE